MVQEILLGLKSYNNQVRPGKPTSEDSDAMLKAIEANQVSSTRRESMNLGSNSLVWFITFVRSTQVSTGEVIKSHEHVTIVFSDIYGFSRATHLYNHSFKSLVPIMDVGGEPHHAVTDIQDCGITLSPIGQTKQLKYFYKNTFGIK